MVKVACVGCGGIMAVHQKNLNQIDGVKMVGHCDIERDRAEASAKLYGGEAFTEYEAMYDKVKPQAVFIAVPPYAHTGMEEAAAARGIHLLIEKPIAINRERAGKIADAIKKSNVICSVAYCFRYLEPVAEARRALKGKAVSLVLGTWNGGMPGVWWWRQMSKSGGQVVEQTTHLFDLARYLCGEVAEVHAHASTGCMTKVKSFDVHDSSVVSLRMKNGAVGCFTSSCVATHGSRVSLQVFTPEVSVTYEGGRVTVDEDGRVTAYSSPADMYMEEAKVFIDAVRTGRRNKIRSSYADALKTFQLTCAANESMQSGMPVKP